MEKEWCLFSQDPSIIYRVSGSQGALYIGRTGRSLGTRLKEHERKNAPWLEMATIVDTTCVKTKETAIKVEKESIAKYCPSFNKMGVPDHCKRS